MNGSISNSTPDDIPDEMLWVSTEAARLAREGGTPGERLRFDQRKAALMAALEAESKAKAKRLFIDEYTDPTTPEG